jgi:hypothetical protein
MDRTGQDRYDFSYYFTTAASFLLFNLKKNMPLMGGY